jgi:ATP-dependent helicase/nuclease subunit B
MHRRLLTSDRALERLDAAAAFVRALPPDTPLRAVGPSRHAVSEPLRRGLAPGVAALGRARFTLGSLAAEIARPALAARGLLPASPLVLDAVAARVVHTMGRLGWLGRFAVVHDRPGLPRALARTLGDLRLAGVSDEEMPVDLRRAHASWVRTLEEAGYADRADVLRVAADQARRGPRPALLVYDVAVRTELERRFVASLLGDVVFATAPASDRPTVARLEVLLGVPEERRPIPGESSLTRVQRHLFAREAPPARDADATVAYRSCPGEARECVEAVRHLRDAALRGVPFDRMALVVRQAEAYRAPLEEAFRRSNLPMWPARGARRPDPAGRAFLALLRCAEEGLSARRFAEYLSIGELAALDPTGAPLPAPAAAPVAFDDELVPAGFRADAPEPTDVEPPFVPSPRKWEEILREAKVVGGLERWKARLAAHRASLVARIAREDPEAEGDPERWRRRLEDIDRLTRFALPIVEALSRLPARATWSAWINHLDDLAGRALSDPGRVRDVLAGLRALGHVGPVDLAEVRRGLAEPLADLRAPPPSRRHGCVFVGTVEDLRGLSFDVVWVAGLAERVFPPRVVEDPLLPDDARERLGLDRAADRADEERHLLRLAVGAAERELILSWPRVDVDHARPRVPSFYGLEVVRASEGQTPGFDGLERRGRHDGAAALGWPAPKDAARAIDDAEHDLAELAPVVRDRRPGPDGLVAFLLDANEHLARALRARARRYTVKRFTGADGLVDVAPATRELLAAHRLTARPWSATTLEQFAACPYRLYLKGVVRLRPPPEDDPPEAMDPLIRGNLAHAVHFRLLSRLRDQGRLPLAPRDLDHALAELDVLLAEEARRTRDEEAPSVPEVFENDVARLHADLREWVRRLTGDDAWRPAHFELGFGHPAGDDHDPASAPDAVDLPVGVRLKGSIDLVERGPGDRLRVTDYKTGRPPAAEQPIVEGGRLLQPVLYAMAAERLFPGRPVEGGRLWFTTIRAGFREAFVPLDDDTRRAAERVITAIDRRIAAGDLPAAPDERACERCDYRAVCGPAEERRLRRKDRRSLSDVVALRELP